MLQTTQDAVRALLKTDPSLTPQDRTAILDRLRSHTKDPAAPANASRLIRRNDAAERLGVTPRTIDYWTKQGILTKFKLPGRTRANGFRESDIEALIQGGGANGEAQ